MRAESPRQDEIDELIVEVSNGKLTARTDWNLLDLFSFGDRDATLFITVPAIDSASSGADINVTGIAGDQVTLDASSGADIEAKAIAGKNVEIEVSSGADIEVYGKPAKVEEEASSGGEVDIKD